MRLQLWRQPWLLLLLLLVLPSSRTTCIRESRWDRWPLLLQWLLVLLVLRWFRTARLEVVSCRWGLPAKHALIYTWHSCLTHLLLVLLLPGGALRGSGPCCSTCLLPIMVLLLL